MTISITGTRFSYAGNNTTTVFSFPRQFFLATDIKVYLVTNATGAAALQSIGTHYSITGAGSPSGGTITMNTAPTTAQTLVIYRDTPLTQGLDLDNVTALPMSSLEAALDRAMMAIDEVNTKALKGPLATAETFDYTLPTPEASKFLRANSSATGLIWSTPPGWLNGTVNPSSTDGVAGDYFLNTVTGVYFQKNTDTTWLALGSLMGPPGSPGSATGAKEFDTVTALLANMTLGYAAAGDNLVVANEYVWVRSGGFAYTVAASGASDHHVTTAGGVKLYVKPSNGSYNVLAFGADNTGITAAQTAINKAISTAYAAGGGIVNVPKGLYKITGTVQFRSWVRIIGEGPEATEFLVATLAPFAQTAGTQVSAGGLIGMSLRADTGYASATCIKLTAVQHSQFHDLVFEGFSSGKIIDIESAAITTYDETVWPKNTPNTIFNVFSHITAYGCATGLSLFGHYGTVPTASPAGSSNVPDIVISQNRYEQIVFWNTTTKGIDIKGCCDSETFDEISINLAIAGAIGVDLASDVAYSGNNYVNSHHFQSLTFSRQAGVNSGSLIRTRWTFGNRFSIEHDLGTGSGVTFFDGASSVSHYILSKNSGDLVSTSNLVIETIEKNVYHGVESGSAASPSVAFQADRTTGFYRGASGEFGIAQAGLARIEAGSGAVSIGGNSTNASLRAIPGATNVNRIDAYGTPSGGGLVKLSATGSDTNLDFALETKGTGVARFGTHGAITTETLTGYITIKDYAGTVRKLAVIS